LNLDFEVFGRTKHLSCEKGEVMKRCILAMLALSLATTLMAKSDPSASAKSPEAAPASDPSAAVVGPSPLAATDAAAPADPAPQAKPEEKPFDPEHPSAIHFKGVTITPGGFVAGEYLHRDRNENADIANTFNNIPFDGTINSNLTETRLTARQSRLSVLVEGKPGTFKMTGYWEADFLGAAPYSNQVESNSFTLRQRVLFAQAVTDGGFGFTAGQQWSLLTLTRGGILPRNEWVPGTIDGQYVVGYNWTRQSGFRFSGDLGNQHKVFLGLSIEDSEITFSGINAPANIQGFSSSVNAQSPSQLIVTSITPGATGVSTNGTPDFLAKVGIDPSGPGGAHIEVKGILSFPRDRTYPNGTSQPGVNNTTTTGGGGAGIFIPFGNGHARLIAGFMTGSGIGRYASGQFSDITVDQNGAPHGIKMTQFNGGLEFTLGEKKNFDIDLYGGVETADANTFVNSAGKGVGYGTTAANNSGCMVEFTTGTQACQAQNHKIYEFTPVFWYRIYNGPGGRLQVGGSYAYVYREAFAGSSLYATTTAPTILVSSVPGSTLVTPKGSMNVIMVSFRYYIP
jgi:hypothetical protein